MKKKIIHVVLPQSFVDDNHLNVLDVAEALSVTYKDKPVSFQVDLVPDYFFNGSVSWLS